MTILQKLQGWLLIVIGVVSAIGVALLKGRRQGREQEKEKQAVKVAAKQQKAQEIKRDVEKEVTGEGRGGSARRLKRDWVRRDDDSDDKL